MSGKIKYTVATLVILGGIGVGLLGISLGFNSEAQAEDSQRFTLSNLWAWPAPATPESLVSGASSQLRRDKNGVWFTIATDELDPGAHTVWVVVFNDPDSCHDGCGGDDLMAGRGNSAAFWSLGAVVGANRTGNFGGYVPENFVPAGQDQILKDNTGGRGIIDAETAEIHLVLRTHGSASEDAGAVRTQLGTFNGDCRPEPDSCKNVQFALYPAP